MDEFPKDPLNRIRRMPERGAYDRETIYAIVDEALICHVAFVDDGRPFVIPTIHARQGDTLYLHGAKASRLIKQIESGQPLCIAVTLVDGLVFARSIFHHSMNYRSALLFGSGRLVDEPGEKLHALQVLSDHVTPERWKDARPPSPKELNATSVVAITIESASAKARSGPPKDDEEDYALPYWAGVLPLSLQAGEAVAEDSLTEERLDKEVRLPDYLANYRRG